MRRNGVNLMEVNNNNIEQGIELNGVKVTLPVIGNKELPVYIATYVLADQGQEICIGGSNHRGIFKNELVVEPGGFLTTKTQRAP